MMQSQAEHTPRNTAQSTTLQHEQHMYPPPYKQHPPQLAQMHHQDLEGKAQAWIREVMKERHPSTEYRYNNQSTTANIKNKALFCLIVRLPEPIYASIFRQKYLETSQEFFVLLIT
jgi:hypothetical protein